MDNLSFQECINVCGTQLNFILLDSAPLKLQSNAFQSAFKERINYLYSCSYRFSYVGYYWTDTIGDRPVTSTNKYILLCWI